MCCFGCKMKYQCENDTNTNQKDNDQHRFTSAAVSDPGGIHEASWDKHLHVLPAVLTADSVNVEHPDYGHKHQMLQDPWCRAVAAHVQMRRHQRMPKQVRPQYAPWEVQPATSTTCMALHDTHQRHQNTLPTVADMSCLTVQNTDQNVNLCHHDPCKTNVVLLISQTQPSITVLPGQNSWNKRVNDSLHKCIFCERKDNAMMSTVCSWPPHCLRMCPTTASSVPYSQHLMAKIQRQLDGDYRVQNSSYEINYQCNLSNSEGISQ